MNQKFKHYYLVMIIVLSLSSQAPAGEVGESSSKSQLNQHVSNLPGRNNERKDEDELCDVTIIVGDKKFRARKDILSSGSPYFKAMFTNKNMRESLEQSNSHTITLHDLDAKAFEVIKNYIYTGRIAITDTNAVDLLAVGSYLQMTDIKADCCAYIKREVNAENCIGIKYIADKYSCSELLNYATEFTLDAFEGVALSEEFLKLSLDQLVDIISEDSLNVNSEEKVYEAAMRWIRYQGSSDDDRTVHLPDILQHVRFSQMTPNYLVGVSEDPLINECGKCRKYVEEAKDHSPKHQSAERGEDKSPSEARFKPRRTNYLFAVGGYIKGQSTSSVERYDLKTDQWTEVAAMTTPRAEVNVAALNNILYAVDGIFVSHTLRKSVECYDPHTDKWTDNVESIESGGTANSVATLNGNLYAIVCYRSIGSISKSVLKYDPNTNEWIHCKPLRRHKIGHSAEVLDGYIYVLGGYWERKVLNTVERYDPTQNEWHDVNPMITKRWLFAAAAHGDYLYAVGGDDDRRTLNSAERYDSRTQQWEEIAPMTEDRCGLGLAVANGLVYAVGGTDSERNVLNTVEVYAPATNTWSGRAPMLHARNYFGLAAMRF